MWNFHIGLGLDVIIISPSLSPFVHSNYFISIQTSTKEFKIQYWDSIMATHPSILNVSKHILPVNCSSKLASSPLATKSSLGSLHSSEIFQAKAIKNLTFAEIANELGRDEVAVAAIVYGQAKASPDDVKNLSKVLQLSEDNLRYLSDGFPVRGHTVDMPPKEPLIYRL